MKLTSQTLKAINKAPIRIKLAYVLSRTEGWIITLINQNPDNSLLTTAAALKVIKKETGLSESEILEESEVSAAR